MLEIKQYTDPEFNLETVRTLFQAYQNFLGIPLDFQDFERELANLPGKYAPPTGNLYLAQWEQQPVGCAAFYGMSNDICEIKRVFVLPEFHGKRIGKQLMARTIQDATLAGYRCMRLDSLRRLKSAYSLYQKFGFYETAPYNHNPHPDVYYMEKAL
jgi:putative acetyltransferase